MNNFLDRYQVPKLNQDQINDLNGLTSPKEIEAIIISLPIKKPKKKKKKKPNQNQNQNKTKTKTQHQMGLVQSSITPSKKT
jgi:hypothetical protein